MKYLISIVCAALCCGCGYFGSNEVILGPVIESIEDTAEGTLITFSVDSNRDIDDSGAEVRAPGETFSLLYDATIQEGANNNQILVEDLSDGPREFRVFVGSGDFYDYSPFVTHEVVSPDPNLPCDPEVNSTQLNFSGLECAPSDRRITAEVDRNTGAYIISVGCSRGFPITFTFPREPNGGVYQTTTSFIDGFNFDPQDRVVRIVYRRSGFSPQKVVDFGQKIYVQTTPSSITLTLCDVEFDNANNFSARLTGRYLLNR